MSQEMDVYGALMCFRVSEVLKYCMRGRPGLSWYYRQALEIKPRVIIQWCVIPPPPKEMCCCKGKTRGKKLSPSFTECFNISVKECVFSWWCQEQDLTKRVCAAGTGMQALGWLCLCMSLSALWESAGEGEPGRAQKMVTHVTQLLDLRP